MRYQLRYIRITSQVKDFEVAIDSLVPLLAVREEL